MSERVRIDKWLWSVRIFKTRNQAAEACRKGRVFIGNFPVKPSREIIVGDEIKVRMTPVTRVYKVLAILEKRVSAKVAVDFVEEITPPEDLKVQEISRQVGWMVRDRGSGRPTKKERRDLDDFLGI